MRLAVSNRPVFVFLRTKYRPFATAHRRLLRSTSRPELSVFFILYAMSFSVAAASVLAPIFRSGAHHGRSAAAKSASSIPRFALEVAGAQYASLPNETTSAPDLRRLSIFTVSMYRNLVSGAAICVSRNNPFFLTFPRFFSYM